MRRNKAWYLLSEVISTAFIPLNAPALLERILERHRYPAPCNGVDKLKSDKGFPHSYLSSYKNKQIKTHTIYSTIFLKLYIKFYLLVKNNFLLNNHQYSLDVISIFQKRVNINIFRFYWAGA
jgi:hypothetical protein